MSGFPFMKDISGAKCLLVGGGEVALRKAQKLRPFGVRVAVCAREVRPELAALAEDVYPAYSPDYLQGALFAVAATDDDDLRLAPRPSQCSGGKFRLRQRQTGAARSQPHLHTPSVSIAFTRRAYSAGEHVPRSALHRSAIMDKF